MSQKIRKFFFFKFDIFFFFFGTSLIVFSPPFCPFVCVLRIKIHIKVEHCRRISVFGGLNVIRSGIFFSVEFSVGFCNQKKNILVIKMIFTDFFKIRKRFLDSFVIVSPILIAHIFVRYFIIIAKRKIIGRKIVERSHIIFVSRASIIFKSL